MLNLPPWYCTIIIPLSPTLPLEKIVDDVIKLVQDLDFTNKKAIVQKIVTKVVATKKEDNNVHSLEGMVNITNTSESIKNSMPRNLHRGIVSSNLNESCHRNSRFDKMLIEERVRYNANPRSRLYLNSEKCGCNL